MNQIVTNSKNSKTIMQVKNHKLKVRLAMRAAFLALCALCFMLPAKAQTRANEIRMKTGTETITDELTYNFYDTGGPYIMAPALDPNNDYNWVTWYQHDESYLLHLVKPAGYDSKGVKITFNYLLINNDFLKIYEGDLENDDNLIVELTNNDYSTGYDTIYQKYTVISHGNMTIRFSSDYHWRDAGWDADVRLETYAPQPPVALMQACDSYIELKPGSKAAGNAETKMYYTLDGNDPAFGDPLGPTTFEYTAPFELTQAGTVKAITVEGEGANALVSSVAAYRFDRLITPPAAPTITHVANTNTVIITAPEVPSGINDTYYVRYSIDGTDPRYSTHEQAKADTIELTQPCTVRAVTRGTTCPDIFSETEGTETINTIYVPTPLINITGSGDNGTVGITCSLTDATIYYTTGGSDPTTSSTVYSGTFTVPAGTTVKAMAYKDGEGYVASNIATAIYIPGGDGSGVYSNVVLLDDREPHSWSYYSDGDQPVHSLKPADVKITYFGNGITMKTNNDYTENTSTNDYEVSTNVAVGFDADANQFIYLKTLENAKEDGSGNYTYTMIPNPFSKRPTYGTPSGTNFTGWRGFQGWRVKRLSGVTIDGYTEGSIIPAETEIEFITNNAEGNEVDFEAVWARAYVGGSYSSNVGYERNFVIGGGAVNYPATYSALYPNGTTNGTTPATSVSGTYDPGNGGRTLNYDSKFEYINLTGGRTFTANNHYLCFGRGISTSNTAAGTLQGISGNVGSQTNPTGLNYTIRLESGTINQLAFVRDDGTNNSHTVYGRVLVKAILGSDYDRANKKDNSKLSVSNSNTLFFTRAIAFASNSNKDQKVFDCVVKSGEFQKSYWDSDVNNFTYTNSMYCGANFNNTTNTHYPGARYVTIEGGALGNINGGRGTGTAGTNDNPDATSPQTDAWKISFSLRIKKDAVINGCVFGGAANTSAWGSKRIVVTGGEVLSWIAGGANGTNTTSGDSRTRGTSYIYVGGNAKVGGPNAKTKNGTLGGQVFGAGRGNTSQAASMDTSYVVIADAAKIMKKNNDASGNVYGGGNIGYIHKASNVYILGGTIEGSVFGGAYGNALDIPSSTVVVKGGLVSGSVYGGSNSTGTVQNDSIYMSGGTVTNVFGGGLGASTRISGNAEVNIVNGTINNNVYGGGELGTVTGNTEVAVSGGTMKNIFGAGKGGSTTANIGGTTTVNVSGGTIAESVYGGGENGNVKQAQNPNNGKGDEPVDPRAIPAVSTVEITGGNIAHNVFGGGSMGFTNGGTVVNMSGGNVEGSVFGGAFGTNGRVYVAGQRTVNLRGGTINKHVYGGSRNADDALVWNPGTFPTNEDETASVVNMSGGYVHYQVFASGYFGNVYGSTYAFIGTNAILNAPHSLYEDNETNRNYFNQHTALRIGGSIWAGGDFGNYDGSKFGDPTITGRSNVYIDGDGYDTESNNTTNHNYMYIGGSIYGSGTSCDAGKQGRHIILRNYGQMINASAPTAAMPYSSATRSLYSIQRADSLVIDNSHVVFLGEGKINSLVTTEKYTIHEFQLVRMANGSSLFLNYPADQIKKFGSYTCPDVYANEGKAEYTKVNYNGLGSSGGSSDNKIRVSNGAFIQIKYVDPTTHVEQYGELEGFAHMMSDDANNTCAYARPKQSTDQGNIIPNNCDNPNDGGFVSYDQALNTYNVNGGTVASTDAIQMPYENHTINLRNGEQYFRIWRAGGTLSYREGVFVAQGNGQDGYKTVDVTVNLPAFINDTSCTSGSYYRIKSFDGNTTIDQGTDVMLVNAACYGNPDGAEWMYIDGDNATANFVTNQTSAQCSNLHYYSESPNVNFGLVAIPEGGLASTSSVTNENMLICETSDMKIATMRWYNTHNEAMPQVTFRLTYNTNLTNNVVWDPMTITFEQVSTCDSTNVLSTVDVALTVTTLTTIDQDFVTQAYAIVRGEGSGTGSYTAKIVLPQYVMHVNNLGEISQWTCMEVDWDPTDTTLYGNSFVDASGDYMNPDLSQGCNNLFGMTLVAGLNFDNTTGWESYPVVAKDMYGWTAADSTYVFGETTARDPIGFDFTLLYDDRQRAEGNYQLGTLTFKMKFTNYDNAVGGDPYHGYLNIKIEVWFLGQGNNYYIDGVHGNNLYSGKYPNAAKKTLSGIFTRTDYRAGDYIFVVDTVTANGSNKLTWNGKAYDEVTLYRYPGGHQLVPDTLHAPSHWDGYDREHNYSYRGPLVRVASNMDMTGIVLNGFYEEAKKAEGEAVGDIEGYYNTYNDNPLPKAPLVEILDGGALSVYGASRMEFNYNSETDGGGIYVANGGVLNLYDGSAVDTNYVASGKNGGGIYVNSTSLVQLSDEVFVTGNRKGIPSAKADESVENNVYLSTYDSHVNVGTVDTDDPYTQLLATSRVGITKNPDWGQYWYAPVAYSDGGQAYLNNLITGNTPDTAVIMWDDLTKYEILSLNNTHLPAPTNYVYFVGTWVTEVTENPQNPSEPNTFDLTQIDTPYELAWLISYVNGLNGASKHPEAVATLTDDIDMSANIWVPITNFTGTFNGNGHVVTGLRSPLNNENMGMFGVTTDAHITDLVAQANFVGGNMKNVGTLIGTMNGGSLSNVEAAGTLTGTASTANMGGLVGVSTSNAVIHSAFAVNTMTGGANTVLGGLVGTNGANLFNSYSNVTLSENNTATTVGGLVGVNNGTIKNCYNATETTYPFAATNNGTITICYAADGTTTYVGASGDDAQLTGHGTYDDVKGRKEIGYLYNDNAVTAQTADTTYVRSKLTYNGKQIATWPGLVSSLNQWVAANTGYTPWLRPTSADINGDLPVLAFPKDNAMGTADGKFLRYGSNVNANGIDGLLTAFNDNGEGDAEPDANIFFYGAATGVEEVPGDNVNVFINEDAVLVQADDAGDFINATVGVTFDNSDHGQHAVDNIGNTLTYDWHMMSSSLRDAALGTSYGNPTGYGHEVNISGMVDSYFPNELPMEAGNDTAAIKWDFYSYSEPHYHWINLKRSDHYYIGTGASLPYTNETTFTPAKGYMMAISQDSYMSSTGTLNKGDVSIALTNQEPDGIDFNKGWNLVGNPYQAYLDLTALGRAKLKAYAYNADEGVYSPFVMGSSENPATLADCIHPHQGFFLYARQDTTVVFTTDMATTTNTNYTYFREEKVNYPLVNIFAENERGNRDMTIIEFNRPEIGGAEEIQGLRNANFHIAAHLDGQGYGLLFAPEGTDRVPVRFYTEEDGTFTLTWETMHGDFTSLLLVDNMTGTITDMLRADHYTFDATTDDYASRFYITFAVTDVEEYNEGDNDFAWFDGSEWVINGKGTLDVVDVLGRTVYSARLTDEQNRVNLNNVAKGVYMLRVSQGTSTKVQKVVVR